MNIFEPIKRWPNQSLHLRNIEIAITVARGKTYRETGSLYNLSGNRVMQIYRILMALLCSRKFEMTFFMAIYNKDFYNHPERLQMLQAYHQDYISWMTQSKV